MRVLEQAQRPPREQFSHLLTDVRRTYRESYRPTLVYAPYLPDFLSHPFYQDKILPVKNMSVWLDYDGVLDQPGREYPFGEHLKTTYSLATHASTVDILTARIPFLWYEEGKSYTHAFYHMPFISDELEHRWRKFYTYKNTACTVKLHHSPSKMFKRSAYEKFAGYVEDALSNNRIVLLIGSGVFDRIRLYQLLQDLRSKGINDVSHLCSVDTGYNWR